MWWRKGTNSSNSSSLAAWQPGPGLRPSRRQQQQLHPSHLYALPNWAPAEHVLVSLSCQQQQEEEQQRVRREAGEAEAVCGAVWVLCFWAHCWFQHNLVSYGMLLLLSLLLLQRVGALAKYLYSAWHEPADTLHTPALSKQTRRNICTHTHTHTWVWKTKWVACWLSHLYTQAERAASERASLSALLGRLELLLFMQLQLLPPLLWLLLLLLLQLAAKNCFIKCFLLALCSCVLVTLLC